LILHLIVAIHAVFFTYFVCVQFRVAELLRGQHGPQCQYQTIFCIWLLTFDKQIAQEAHQKFDLIPCLVDIGKGSIKEKVIRMVLAVLRVLIVIDSLVA
jgi:V-type H+-transporting ATPase subunit H